MQMNNLTTLLPKDTKRQHLIKIGIHKTIIEVIL